MTFAPSETEPYTSDRPFTAQIERVSVLSRGKELSGQSLDIATSLIWYGGWQEGDEEPEIVDGKLRHMTISYTPSADVLEADDHQLMGPVSSMISRAFRDEADQAIRPAAAPEMLKPGYMGKEFVPENWLELDLDIEISKFRVLPNYEIGRKR